MLTVGIPMYSSVLQKNRIGTTSSLLYTTLNVARGEALKRRSDVRVCPSSDGASCRGDGDWSDGWLTFDDVNSNDSPETAEIIRVVDALESGVTIVVTEPISGYLQFRPTGVMVGNAGNSGEFRICHVDSSVFSHVLNISTLGQVSLEQRTQSDCGESA
jgi:type IV fimbrial biogenesis protein FimT